MQTSGQQELIVIGDKMSRESRAPTIERFRERRHRTTLPSKATSNRKLADIKTKVSENSAFLGFRSDSRRETAMAPEQSDFIPMSGISSTGERNKESDTFQNIQPMKLDGVKMAGKATEQ